MKLINFLPVLALLLTMPALVSAQDSYEHVPPTCFVTATDINFGHYITSAPPVDGEVTVTCDFTIRSDDPHAVHAFPQIEFHIELSAGQHSGGSFDPRKMANYTRLGAGDNYRLNYNLFKSNGEVWGNGDFSTKVQDFQFTDPRNGTGTTGTGAGRVLRRYETFPVRGQIRDNQDVFIGQYKDRIMVTVVF